MGFISHAYHQPKAKASIKSKHFFQTKTDPWVSKSNDPVNNRDEQEADRVSEQVMNNPGSKERSPSFFPPKPNYIQKRCACEIAEKQPIQANMEFPTIQRQASPGEEEEQTGEVLTGGLGIVASEALKHEPLYNFLDARLFSYLKHTFWEDRTDAEKALIVGHSVLTLAPLGMVFTTPHGRETFSGVDLGSVFSWIPYNPIGGFSYNIPDTLHPTSRFRVELQADDYLNLLHESDERIPEMALSLGLSGERRESGGFGLTGGSFELSIGGGIVDLTGFINQPISPYPILLPGRHPGDSPTWLMRELPGISEDAWPQGTGFMFKIDVLRLPQLWGAQPLLGPVTGRPAEVDELAGPSVFRKSATGEMDLPRKGSTGNTRGAHIESVEGLSYLSGAGKSLSASEKNLFEPRFGYDFSHVRLHTNAKANESAHRLHALAYTHGNHIVFGSNQYQPGTDSGKKLLAHELTHVVQQNRDKSANFMRVPDESGINESPPRYSFSTNCGWIDWTHASPGMTRILIDAVQNASDRMASSGSTTPERVIAPRMESVGGPIFLSGVTPIVHIKKVLTADEVLQVALRIFMLQSLGFEALQNWTDAIGSSSFSEEDLSSNLISFYMAARSFNRSDVETFCDVWDSARSISKFKGYTFNKRISFHPGSLLPPGGAWPAEFSTISPAVTGGLLMDTPTALFETTFSSFSRGLAGYEMIADPSLGITSLDSGGTTIDISGTVPGSAHGPHFEVSPIVPGHNLLARWMIRDAANERYRMRGDDESFVDHYGDQLNAYINAPTRELLRDKEITSATVLCRVRVGQEGEDAILVRLLELPVRFTW